MPNPGPNERLSELVSLAARAIHETMWVDPGPWPCDDESHLDGGCTDYVTGQAEATLTAAGVPELLSVVEAARADHYQNERLIELNRCWCGEDATECRYLVALEALPTEPPMKGEA